MIKTANCIMILFPHLLSLSGAVIPMALFIGWRVWWKEVKTRLSSLVVWLYRRRKTWGWLIRMRYYWRMLVLIQSWKSVGRKGVSLWRKQLSIWLQVRKVTLLMRLLMKRWALCGRRATCLCLCICGMHRQSWWSSWAMVKNTSMHMRMPGIL